MFERLSKPLETYSIESLWLSARESWSMACAFFQYDFPLFAATPLSRRDHAIIYPMVIGLEHFVRRALLLAAMAMQALPLIRRSPQKAAVRTPAPRGRQGLRIFELERRRSSGRGQRRWRIAAAGPHPGGPRMARYDREREHKFRLANLARDPLEPRRSAPVAPDLRPACTEAPSALPLRPDTVSGRGLAVRMCTLLRILKEPDAVARRLRRAMDRHNARRAETPAIGPLRIPPWPRDRFARRNAEFGELALLWPGAESAITAMLDNAGDAPASAPEDAARRAPVDSS